jgi:hypothetical protein
MRRSLAFIVLLVIVSVPALKLGCTLACAPEAPASGPVGCHHHHQPAAAALFSQSRCCGQFVSPVSAATVASGQFVSLRTASLVKSIVQASFFSTDFVKTSFNLQKGNAPPGPAAVPLRI